MFKINSNISLIIKSTFGLLLAYQVCRLLFFIANYNAFSDVSLIEYLSISFWSVKFDLSAIVYTNAMVNLLILFRTKAYKFYNYLIYTTFIINNGIAILINCIDIEYYKFIFKRTSFDLFLTQGLSIDLFNLIPQFLKDYWYLLLFWLIIVITLSHFFIRAYKNYTPKSYTVKGIVLTIVNVCLLSGLTIFIGRGGIQYRPIITVSAANYTKPQYVPLLINTPFTILTSYEQTSITPLTFFDENKLKKELNPLHSTKFDKELKKNVMLIILESFSKEYFGYYNNGNGYTPFLDSLMQKSIVFENAYANGKRSNEGIPAIIGGVPSLMSMAYGSSTYASNNINSIAELLKRKGYYSVFYHGAENGTMGFDQLCKVAQFDSYFGRTEYNNDNDYDGTWGIWDEPFLQRVIKENSKLKEPFLATVFTLSSHHPFVVPKQYTNKFKKGPIEILQTVGYTDYALKKFFEVAKKEKWFNNTVFFITADHTGPTNNLAYNNRVGYYKIPYILYDPSNEQHQSVYATTQQIDIIPTLVDYLKLNLNYYGIGNSSLQKNKKGYAINFLDETYQYINDSMSIILYQKQLQALYNYKNDSALTNNVAGQQNEYLPAINHCKAIIQTYTTDVVQNKTFVK